MNAEEVVKNFMAALEASNFDTASTYLADNFIFSGWTPQPLAKEQFLTVMSSLKEGIPNLTYNFQVVHDKRDPQDKLQESYVKITTRMTGTQTDSFILPPLGLPPIPQMVGTLSMPEEIWNFTLADDKITRIAVSHVPDGGIQGLLHQLGVDMPVIP